MTQSALAPPLSDVVGDRFTWYEEKPIFISLFIYLFSLKGKRKTRTLPGGTLSMERWKNLTMTVYGLRNHRRGTVERKIIIGRNKMRTTGNWENWRETVRDIADRIC